MVCDSIVINAAGSGLIQCFVGQTLGLDWVLFGFLLLGIIALFAYSIKLPAIISLALGFSLIFSVDLLSGGGNQIFALLLLLLGFGLIASIVLGILKVVQENAQ